MKTLKTLRKGQGWTTGLAGLLSGLIIFCAMTPADIRADMGIETRIKDIAKIEGLYSQPLIGYGIVIGLHGTGDKDIELTKQTVANLLERFQITIPSDDIKSKNVAAVLVTASAPPYHHEGDRIDVQVSTIGDATSLEGGVLMMTPLLSADGELYALAQGGLTVSGYSSGQGGMGGQQNMLNYTSVGLIPGGGILNRSDDSKFIEDGILRLSLNKPDFTTASRVSDAINEVFEGAAVARDAGSIHIRVPDEMLEIGQSARFVATLEILRVKPDIQSKVIINERSGTIVMGGNVQVGSAVVAHGNLTVKITSTLATYMPEPFTDAPPVVTEQIDTRTHEEPARVMLINGTSTVQELAEMLNQVGTTPRDLISILEALHQLGALQMDVETM